MSIEEKLDAILKSNYEITSSNQELKSSNQELQAQNEFLRKQLGVFLKQEQKLNEESIYSPPRGQEQVFSHDPECSSDEEPSRRSRPEQSMQANSNDFRVEIPEFEGKLDPEDFLDWLHTVERVLSTRTSQKTRR